MPITHPIRSAAELRDAVRSLEARGYWPGDISVTHYDTRRISFEPNILDGWARGEYFEVKPRLLRPSIQTVTDSDFHLLREYIRDITQDRSQPISTAAALSDNTGEKFPRLILENGRVRVTYFRTINDCRNDIRATTTVARYLIGEDFSENAARDAAEYLDAEYGLPHYDIYTDTDDIVRMFKASHSGLRSCMTKPSSDFGLPETLHPTMAHGSPGELGMAVLWSDEQRTTASARCLVWPAKKIFNRCYGLSNKLANALIQDGWRFGNFDGAKIATPVYEMTPLEGRKVQLSFMMPYVDVVLENSTDYSNNMGAAAYTHTARGVFVHQGTAYLELELQKSGLRIHESDGYTQAAYSTNHHATGKTSAIAYYYPGKDKIYIGDRSRFVQIKGRARPRRYDIKELCALGYQEEDFYEVGNVTYSKDMLYLDEDDGYVTPERVWAMQEYAPLVIFPGNIVVPRSRCRRAADTQQYALERDLFLDALSRQYLQNRQRYVATLSTPGRELAVTASSLEYIFDLTRETDHGRITFNQTDFDNGEVQLQVINPRTGDRTLRQVGGVSS